MKGKSLTPKVEPISQPEWRSAQPNYPSLPEAGITNGLLVKPSFTGKTTWLSSWILDWYRGAYARIFVFSPNALTPEWEPVKNYVEGELGVDPDDEPFLFETLDEGELASIISTQKKGDRASEKGEAPDDACHPDRAGRPGERAALPRKLQADQRALHPRPNFFHADAL